MRFKVILFFLLINFFTNYSQEFQWVRTYEGSYFSGYNKSTIEVDANENTYTFGAIYEPIFDIDPTSGIQIIDNTITSHQCSLFLTKLDINGDFVWGKTFGSIYGTLDRVIDMEIGNDGNIYLLADIYEQTSFMQKYITIIKLDSQGNTLMTKKITNLNNPNQYDIYSSSSLALDNQNNIYLTGSYKFHLKIDPINPALDFKTGGDSFLLKLDNSGNILFGKKFNVLFTNTHYENVKIDSNQNPIIVVSNGDNQSYNNYGYNIYKINPTDGSIFWQKYLDKQDPITFNVDKLNNLILAGNAKDPYGGDIDVDPNSTFNNISPTRYLLWLDKDGSFIDVKQYPALSAFSYFAFTKIEFDNNNNTYVVGEFRDSFDADPSNNNLILSYTGGGRDAFYIKFNNLRMFEKAFKLGDYNNNYINFYFNDFKIKNENQYYTGNFSYTADFDPTTNNYLLSTNEIFGSRFTLKLGPCDKNPPIGQPNQYFCSIDNPTINSLTPNNNTISWYDSLTSTVPLNSNQVLINGQTYYASEKIGSCPESDRLVVTAHISQTPAKPATSSQSFCENQSPTVNNLSAIGQNIKWYDSLTNGNLLPLNTQLQNNTNYYVSQTVNNCESERSSVLVTISLNPKPTATSPQSFCIQQNATLNNITITGQNIKWYDAQTGGNLISVSTLLQNNTTYYASQTINNCESERIAVTVNVYNTPPPTANSNQSFCSSQNATLNDIAIAGTDVKWYTSSNNTIALPITTSLANNTTYYASQTLNGCESVNRTPVTITLINTLNASNYADYLCDDLNNGNEKIDLTSYNSSLISNLTGSTFTYYKSKLGAENKIPSEKINNEKNYELKVGSSKIYVRIENINTCFQIVELDLTLYNNPIIPIAEVTPICQGNTIKINAGNFDSYIWSTQETAQEITISTAGDYWVTVTENHTGINCSSSKNFKVVNSNIASIQNISISDWTDNNNSITVILSSGSMGDYEYSIDGITYQSSNVFTNLTTGEYTVYVRDKNGCGTAKDMVYLISYPKYFTPNGDGINDFWKIRFSQNEPNLTIHIYNRFGKLLKTLNNDSQGWDGTYLGEPLPSDDYWFTVVRANGTEYKGHFSLKR